MKPMKNPIVGTMMLIVGSMAVAVPARADLVFFQGIQGGANGTEDVQFNGADNILGAAKLLQGHIQGGVQIGFSSAQNLVATNGSGKITAADRGAAFQDLRIFFTSGETFTKAIFNLDAALDGSVTISALAGDNSLGSDTFALNGHGNNFFTVNAPSGTTELDITSTVALNHIGQVRVGSRNGELLTSMAVAPVPEPASVALLGTAALGTIIFWKRRTKRAYAAARKLR